MRTAVAHAASPMRRAARLFGGHRRLIVAMVCAAVAYPVLPAVLSSSTRAVLAWNVGVTVFLLLSALSFSGQRAARMRIDAKRQQEGEWTIFSITIGAVVFSFIAIIAEFADIKDLHGAAKLFHVSLVGVTLLLSWLMTHTTFAFRYAHEYYEGPPDGDVDGGLDFPGKEPPDYLDFMYFSLVLGMTFQVSDVQITSRKLRRLATLHGLLSFLFNTIILALSINIAAGALS